MKRTLKQIVVFALCALAAFLLPVGCAAAEEEAWELPLTVAASVSGVPEGAVMLDVLVPENEADAAAFNEKNGRAFGVTAESEIANLNADGYVSFTFCTPASQPRNELAYDITVAVAFEKLQAEPERFAILEGADYEEEDGVRYYDLRVIPGTAEEAKMLAFADSMGEDASVYETIYTSFPMDWKRHYSAVRAAYLDVSGNVLGVSDVCAIDPDTPGGYWLELNGLSISTREMELDYYYNPILPILLVGLCAVLVLVICLLLLRRIERTEKRKYLPGIYFKKTKATDPALRRARRRSRLPYWLVNLPFLAAGLALAMRIPEVPLFWRISLPWLAVLLEFFFFILWIALNGILHELGHVLAGKRVGMRFISMQVACCRFYKKEGRLRCKFPAGGLNGATLLAPPEGEPDARAFRRMDLGGGVMNLLLLVAAVLCAVFVQTDALRIFFAGCALITLYLLVVNLVPDLAPGVISDGTHLRDDRKYPAYLSARADAMRISAAAAEKTPITQMPEAWFHPVTEESLAVPQGAFNALFTFDRYLEELRFEEAVMLGRALLHPASGLYLNSKTRVAEAMVLALLLAGESPETVEAFLVRERRKAALRLPAAAPDLLYKYAWELLGEKNPEKAASTLAFYQKRFPENAEANAGLLEACRDMAERQTEM